MRGWRNDIGGLRGTQPHNRKTPSRGTRDLLGNTREANREPEVSVVVAVRAEAAVVEVHAARAAATAARSRPVVAVRTDTVNRSPVPAARSRQEDCTGLL